MTTAAAPRTSPTDDDRVRHLSWQVTVSVGLLVLALVQRPGLIAPDTKLDLLVRPGALLARASTLWDPLGAAGQLQNQAYGYLFPMGPFFAVGDLVGLPAWLVQRLWWALILLLAYHGSRRVCAALGVGTPWTRTVAALAYALSPRLLGTLGAVSVEVWPMAVAPWVLLPLLVHRPGQERRQAARSAVAVLCLGGVNAIATGAALMLPAWWLVTRRAAPGTRRLLVWWAVLTVAACAWWAVPLLLLGRYSPPFLDWIESAAVTTAPGALPEVLRGTTQWIAGIIGAEGERWPAAFAVLTSSGSVALGLVLALLGLAGLARRDAPHRTVLLGGLLVGVALVGAGHVGALAGPWAPVVQDLLDGPLAPLRNVHKFEPVVRLPLVVGLAHLLAVVRPARVQGAPWTRQSLALAACACLVAQAAPAALVGVAQRGSFREVPTYWEQAADFLATGSAGGRTLVLPGVSFATSRWGDPRDEPLQPLARTPWLVRDAVPLGSGGATRVLTAVEERVASGYGGPELQATLRRLGVTRVVLRHDLDWRAVGAPAPLVARQAVTSMPSARRLAFFGPLVGGGLGDRLVLDDGLDQPVPAIEVYDVAAASGTDRPGGRLVSATVLADVPALSGGPEAALHLTRTDPFVLAAQPDAVRARASGGPAAALLTDTLQRRESDFATVRGARGPLMAPQELFRADRAVHDWLPAQVPVTAVGEQTTAGSDGGATAVASSTSARPAPFRSRVLAGTAAAAFDGDPETAWRSSGQGAVGQWVELRSPTPVDAADRLSVTLATQAAARVTALRVTTDSGTLRSPVDLPVGRQESVVADVAVPAGPTRRVRVAVAEAEGLPGLPVIVKEVSGSGLPSVRALADLPRHPLQPSGAVSLMTTDDRRPECVVDVERVTRCSPASAVPGEQDRRLTRRMTVAPDADGAAGPATWRARGTVLPVPGDALEALLDEDRAVRAVGSSRWADDPRLRPGAAVDGDPTTYWAPAVDDAEPTLALSWPRARTVSGLTLDTEVSVAGSRPTRVRVTVDGRSYDRTVDVDGAISIPSERARELSLTVLDSVRVDSLRARQRSPLPVVIGDVRVRGLEDLQLPLDRKRAVVRPCGFGPELEVGGVDVPTRVLGTVDAVLGGRPLEWLACEPVRPAPGEVVVDAAPSAEFAARSLRLFPSDASAAPPRAETVAATPRAWEAERRQVDLAPRSQPVLLRVAENHNEGWVARANGRRLQPLVVDGWAQGWVVPAGPATRVELEFTPGRAFRAALVVGLLAALAVVALALPGRGSAPPERKASPRTLNGARVPRPLLGVGLVTLTVVAVGPVGLVAAPAALLRRHRRALAVVGLAAAVLLVPAAAWAPWPAPEATNRGAAATALAALAVSAAVALALPVPRTRPRDLPRSGRWLGSRRPSLRPVLRSLLRRADRLRRRRRR